jgi:hypothetical protein
MIYIAAYTPAQPSLNIRGGWAFLIESVLLFLVATKGISIMEKTFSLTMSMNDVRHLTVGIDALAEEETGKFLNFSLLSACRNAGALDYNDLTGTVTEKLPRTDTFTIHLPEYIRAPIMTILRHLIGSKETQLN